jgi:2-polyprenyl-3-methyl-5-hydroxy-6-metoxy-1,4-benzoquinol methylase
MDKGPKFAYQTKLWVKSLTIAAAVDPEDIVVHAIDRCSGRQVESVERLGVRVVQVAPFDPRHPFSNKLVQLGSAALEDASYVVLCDCDLAFAGSLDELLSGDLPKAKPVDTATPDAALWSRIFARFGLNPPPADSISTWSRKPTIWNNCNGGIYVLPHADLMRLAEPWRRWDRKLIENSIVLEGQDMFIDQVAFALACEEMSVRVEHLPPKYNTPTHLEYTPECQAEEEPVVLHYHSRVDGFGYLRPTTDEKVDAAISKVNARILEDRRQAFDNAGFWDFRYGCHPESDSRVGSQDATAYKARLLKDLFRTIRPASVLDVGCGDLAVCRRLRPKRYLGVDVSEEAIQSARAKRRRWSFLCGDFLDLELERADLVLCLDVLIHQPDLETYTRFCDRLLSLAGGTLLLGAYNQEPWDPSDVTFYYEPISSTVRRLRPDAGLEVVGGYGDRTVLRVDVA